MLLIKFFFSSLIIFSFVFIGIANHSHAQLPDQIPIDDPALKYCASVIERNVFGRSSKHIDCAEYNGTMIEGVPTVDFFVTRTASKKRFTRQLKRARRKLKRLNPSSKKGKRTAKKVRKLKKQLRRFSRNLKHCKTNIQCDINMEKFYWCDYSYEMTVTNLSKPIGDSGRVVKLTDTIREVDLTTQRAYELARWVCEPTAAGDIRRNTVGDIFRSAAGLEVLPLIYELSQPCHPIGCHLVPRTDFVPVAGRRCLATAYYYVCTTENGVESCVHPTFTGDRFGDFVSGFVGGTFGGTADKIPEMITKAMNNCNEELESDRYIIESEGGRMEVLSPCTISSCLAG